jgi:hypothetical protein
MPRHDPPPRTDGVLQALAAAQRARLRAIARQARQLQRTEGRGWLGPTARDLPGEAPPPSAPPNNGGA